jgi:hypothetical protein
MTSVRVRLDRDVSVVGETNDGLVLQGSRRLRPGQVVELIEPSAGHGPGRPAQILTWRVSQVGSAGLVFRGHCRWLGSAGNRLPAGGE